MRIITKYVCELCEKEYSDKDRAHVCENKGVRDMEHGHLPMVGDIVECGIPYGWHSKPDTIWARKFADMKDQQWGGHDPNRFVADGGCLSFSLIWIVTAITVRDHKRIYHLYCPEPPQYPSVYWTSPDHLPMHLAKPNAERETWRNDHEAIWRGVEAERRALL